MPIQQLRPTAAHRRLRLYSLIAAAVALLQAILGGANMAAPQPTLSRLHAVLGILYVLVAILATFPAKVWGDQSHRKGLFGHAAGMAALGVVQVVLGLVNPGGPGPLTYLHVALGVAILVGAVALFLVARRMPIIVTHLDRPPDA